MRKTRPPTTIDPFFRNAAGLEPFHHAGTALEHGYTRIDTWPRLRNAEKRQGMARHLLVLPHGTHAARLPARAVAATARERHDPVDCDADVRVKHIVDFALEAERKCGHRQLVVNITKN